MVFVGTHRYQLLGYNPIDALRAIITDIKKKYKSFSTVFFVTGNEDIESVNSIIHEEFDDAITLGINSKMFYNGIIGDGDTFLACVEDDDNLVVVPGLIENVSKCPVRYIADIEQSILDICAGEDDTICLEYTTGGEELVVTTLNAAFAGSNIQLMGGSINASHEELVTAVFYEGVIYRDACIYMFIKNLKGRIHIFDENLYERFDDTPHYATKVDIEKRALIEIDGKPAADVIADALGVEKDNLVKQAIRNPLGRYIGDKKYIVAMHDLDENGTLYNYKQVNVNDILYIMKLEDYHKLYRETLDKIKKDIANIGFVISIDCINRYRLYKMDNFLQEYISTWHNEIGNHFGMVSAGEQFCTQHINQAMVCAVFENVYPDTL